uniref:Uncharacterized protein n=1 Tax=Moniliophthora roreri TaxID=221103 RepID=A0A0W0F0W4_MONRR
MSPPLNFDDPNQSVFFIPHNESDTDDTGSEHNSEEKKPGKIEDLLGGKEIRWDVYRAAWTKCLSRIQDLLNAIYEPFVMQVVECAATAYQDDLPGLPYPEIPIITLTSSSSSPAFLQQVITRLETQEKCNFYTAHLYPPECINIMSAMKSLVSTFTKNSGGHRGSGQTLAAYDIRVLDAWYQALSNSKKKHGEALRLIVMLHNFEQFEPSVIQDLLRHISRIPLVFIITLSSPQSPSYLHSTYPRSTLALLRIQNFRIPSGISILEEILLDTFVSIEFNPDLVLGPAALESIIDSSIRHNLSVDSLVNHLQLAHLKHFSTVSLSALLHETVSASTLENPASFHFLESLVIFSHAKLSEDTDWKARNVPGIISIVDDARKEFYARVQGHRIAFGLLRLVQEFMEQRGYKGLELTRENDLCPKYLKLFINMKRGDITRELKHTKMLVSKLKSAELEAFGAELEVFCDKLPPETQGRNTIIDDLCSTLPEKSDEFAKRLLGFIDAQLRNALNDTDLWQIWYTGDSPFPSEIINPSVRASIISGLLRPKDFITLPDTEHSPKDELWERPDTSILFDRYLDSGKMINVYDWFESFHVVLETQREKLEEKRRRELLAERVTATTPGSPRKRKSVSPRKEKQKAKEDEEDGLDEGQWKMQVQARFIRAVHELDYLGFIKHTKRKQDHVLRTVFDVKI